jgi:hypothetical protein
VTKPIVSPEAPPFGVETYVATLNADALQVQSRGKGAARLPLQGVTPGIDRCEASRGMEGPGEARS